MMTNANMSIHLSFRLCDRDQEDRSDPIVMPSCEYVPGLSRTVFRTGDLIEGRAGVLTSHLIPLMPLAGSMLLLARRVENPIC